VSCPGCSRGALPSASARAPRRGHLLGGKALPRDPAFATCLPLALLSEQLTLLVIALALVAGAPYAAEFVSGRAQGEMTAHTISAAMAAGPAAVTVWGLLMADNEPVQALAPCRKSVSTDANGRRLCAMPVWLDAPAVQLVKTSVLLE
jgi:hypothetical protein